MNDLYFACRTCKNYHDAGYRWCYWTLGHPGMVQRGQLVNLNAVWNASEYWSGISESDWLRQLLPKVRTFLEHHQAHEVMYGEGQEIRVVALNEDDDEFVNWLSEPNCALEFTPR